MNELPDAFPYFPAEMTPAPDFCDGLSVTRSLYTTMSLYGIPRRRPIVI